jgi:hypothetical protein
MRTLLVTGMHARAQVGELHCFSTGNPTVRRPQQQYAHAFVWQKGTMRDLNTLIPAGSPLTLNVAYTVNEAGVIAGLGTNSAGDTHAFILVPASESMSERFENAASAPIALGSSVRMPSPLEGILRPLRPMHRVQ